MDMLRWNRGTRELLLAGTGTGLWSGVSERLHAMPIGHRGRNHGLMQRFLGHETPDLQCCSLVMGLLPCDDSPRTTICSVSFG